MLEPTYLQCKQLIDAKLPATLWYEYYTALSGFQFTTNKQHHAIRPTHICYCLAATDRARHRSVGYYGLRAIGFTDTSLLRSVAFGPRLSISHSIPDSWWCVGYNFQKCKPSAKKFGLQ